MDSDPRLARFGALLRSYSTDPLTAKLGADDLRSMDEYDLKQKEDQAKAKATTQGVFLQLLKTGIDNGVDEPTLQKFASGAGLEDMGGLRLGGINKNDPITQRQGKAAALAKDFDPASIDAWVQTGQFSTLKPLTKPDKPVVLQPGAMAVGSDGEVLAENKNPRFAPRAQTNVGYKQQMAETTLARNNEARAKLNPEKLSDRYKAARMSIEDKTAQGLIGVPEAAKMRQALDSRRETLIKFDNSAERVMDILEKNPAAATVGADAAKAWNSFLVQGKGLLSLIPGADLTDIDLDQTDWSEQLNSIAGDNAELRTAMFSVAMMTAAADGFASGRMTNQMIDQAIQNVGAGGRTPAALKRKMREARRRVADAFETTLSGALDEFSALDRPDPTAPPQPPAGKPSRADLEAEARRRGLPR